MGYIMGKSLSVMLGSKGSRPRVPLMLSDFRISARSKHLSSCLGLYGNHGVVITDSFTVPQVTDVSVQVVFG
jgi:hypothetical protein